MLWVLRPAPGNCTRPRSPSSSSPLPSTSSAFYCILALGPPGVSFNICSCKCSHRLRFVPFFIFIYLPLTYHNHHLEQVIAPYLIIIRIANRRAFASDAGAEPANVSSMRFDSRGKTTDGSGVRAVECTNAGELGVGIETTISDLHRGGVSESEGSSKT